MAYANTISRKLNTIKAAIDVHREEIEYLETILTSTSGPANDVIADLNRNRSALAMLETELSLTMNELQILREKMKERL